MDKTGKTVVFSENRMTYYKLHPSQEKYPGAIIEMPSLPNDVYHRDLWYHKGYKLDPQDLMPGKKIVWSEVWGCRKFDIPLSETTQPKRTCEICGKECIGDFGLQAHKKSHDKN